MAWTTQARLMGFYESHVKEITDIVEELKEYISLEEKSGTWWGDCPFCFGEKSFSASRASGGFYCFRCHAGGNVFKFISMLENISYWDAVKKIGKKHGIKGEALHDENEEKGNKSGNKSD